MLTLHGYVIRKLLHEGRSAKVYKAIRTRDGMRVILKCLESSSSIRLAKLRREYELGRFLRSEYILRYFDLEEGKSGPVIVMEDFGGKPLTSMLDDGPLSLDTFLDLAVNLADILAEIHRKNVIHKDIKPDNFLLNPETGKIKIIDFGIACLLPSERATLRAPDMLEGTIGYMSPEQRGITNRAIDYRTDFYALGATYYHLLVGHAPGRQGAAEESLGTYNTYGSSEEESPNYLEAEENLLEELEKFPRVLVQIIQKCMAENPEDRYQTAQGLVSDLERASREYREKQKIRSFKLGQLDLPQRLQVPQKLYGREYEISRLMSFFQRTRNRQRSYMVLVSGEAGIGKSSVIHEIQKSIVMRQGIFVSGRCGQFKKETPYDPFISVAKALINQILTESEVKIDRWRRELLKVLGESASLVCELIPELERLLGARTPLTSMSKEDSQMQMQRAYQLFLSVFARRTHPLTVFLDDLHWADDASLALLEYLLINGNDQALFLVGTYRFDGSEGAHMLASLVRRLATYGDLCETLSVSSLELEDTVQLISETLGCGPRRVELLARLVDEHTHGNPFFIIQFLRYLYEKGFLYCNLKAGAWKWSIREIRASGIPKDLIALLTESILTLPKPTLELLEQAACIGHRFDLKTLVMVRGRSAQQIAADLMPALKKGWIQPDDGRQHTGERGDGDRHHERRSPERFITYTFMHGYIQQAAYSLLGHEKAKTYHYAIGRHFFNTIDRTRTDRYLMEIVEHLHKADVRDPHERLLLAEWYLRAGTKAGSTAGFTLGLNYFQLGRQYLPEKAWKEHYQLTLELRLGEAEMAFFDGQFDLLRECCNQIRENARQTLDLIPVYQLQAQYHAAHQQFKETLEVVSEALNMLNHKLPEAKTAEEVCSEAEALLFEAGGIEQLERLPLMRERQYLAMMRLLSCAVPAAFFSQSDLFPGIALELTRLSIRHGIAPESCCAFGSLVVLLDELDLSYHLGKMATRLVERFDARRLRPQVLYHYCCFIQHRKEHLDQVLISLRRCIVAGFEIREFEYATRCEVEYAMALFFKGAPLDMVQKRLKRFTTMTAQTGQSRSLTLLHILQQLTMDLMDLNECEPMEGMYFRQSEYLHLLREDEFHEGIFVAGLAGAFLYYFRGQLNKAITCLELAEANKEIMSKRIIYPELAFFAGLIYLGVAAGLPEEQRGPFREKAQPHLQLMRLWSDSAPMNRLHQHHILEAEMARASGKKWEALEHYNQAVTLAHNHGFLLGEAMAAERLGKFFAEHRIHRCATPYLETAMDLYQKLGISAKSIEMNHLREQMQPEQ